MPNLSDDGLDLAGTAGASTTREPLTYFVRAADGNDGNTGKTTADPLASLAPLETLIPQIVRPGDTVTVRLGAGTYSAADLSNAVSSKTFGAPVIFHGDGGGTGDGFTVLQATEATDGTSTATSLTKVGGGLTPDAFLGKTIDIVSGTGAGQRRTIAENTATAFIPCKVFSPVPDATSMYRIVEPAVSFDVATDTPLAPQTGQKAGLGNKQITYGSLVMINLSFTGAAVGFNAIEYSTCSPVLFGVEQVDGAGTIGFALEGCRGNAGKDDNLLVDLGIISTAGLWEGWGYADLSAGVFGNGGFDSSLTGYFVHQSLQTFRTGMHTVVLGGRFVTGINSPIAAGSVTELTPGSNPFKIRSISIRRGSELIFSGGQLEGGAGSRITVAAGATLELGSAVTLASAVTSPDRIVQAQNGGDVRLAGQPNASMVNSGADGYDVGDGSPVGRGTFTSVGTVKFNTANGSRILRTS